MHELILHTVTVFMGFFAIMNPVANVPIFLGLTQDYPRPLVKAVALRSMLLAFVIVVIFSITGKVIFELFAISMPAFRLTGGILVFMIGYRMLEGNQSAVHQLPEEQQDKTSDARLKVAISPLAVPILAGPGTIATALNFSASGELMEMVLTIIAFALLCVLTFILFLLGEKLVALVGAMVMDVITRMMGLILAVIGIQMGIDGLQGAFGPLVAAS